MACAIPTTGASARLADTPTITLARRAHVRATIADLDGETSDAVFGYELAASLYRSAGDAEMALVAERAAAELGYDPALPLAA